MEGIVRNIFPGGNTPKGFYSYYRYILPQESAERIFCIKGGPGVGKSTMMKKIANHFIAKGESVDMFWCSADPDSLDGVLLKQRNISIVDGTAPHIIDPINPGAVDEIIDLGQYLDYEFLRSKKKEIIHCSHAVSTAFKEAYHQLKKACMNYDFIFDKCENAIIDDADNLMQLLDGISSNEMQYGQEKRFFSYAITYKGIVDHTETLLKGINNIFTINGVSAIRTEEILRPIANKLLDKGFNIELYYSPIYPDTRIEHIISREADLAIFTRNKENTDTELNIVFDSLKTAKQLHDDLEGYYIPAMDFSKTEESTIKLIKTIENLY